MMRTLKFEHIAIVRSGPGKYDIAYGPTNINSTELESTMVVLFTGLLEWVRNYTLSYADFLSILGGLKDIGERERHCIMSSKRVDNIIRLIDDIFSGAVDRHNV